MPTSRRTRITRTFFLDAQSLDADSSDGGHLDPLPLDAGECRSHLDPVSDRQATEVCDNRYRICLSNAEFCLGTCPDAGPIPPERHCELEHLACCRRGPYDCPRYSVVRELVDNNALYSVLPLCEE